MSTAPERAAREETAASAQASPIVRFDQASLRREGEVGALRSASFALAPGSFHMLLGPRGSGKTSLLRLICLAETPSQGLVQVFGRDVSTLSRREAALARRRIGAVLQPLVFLDHLTVWDNAALPARAIARPLADYAPQVDQVLGWLGLTRQAEERPPALDPSARWRLALARAVVNRPDIVLLDAPGESLDTSQQERLVRLAGELNAAGATVLVATRDEALAAASGRPLLKLQDGRVILADGGLA